MKLSRLYSNKSDLFEPVEFVQGLNVVIAEIRLPENRNRDTHNLGKTTLGRLLDFGFLAKRDPKFFLFKHIDLFQKIIFFLEIELEDASFVTIRRGRIGLGWSRRRGGLRSSGRSCRAGPAISASANRATSAA